MLTQIILGSSKSPVAKKPLEIAEGLFYRADVISDAWQAV